MLARTHPLSKHVSSRIRIAARLGLCGVFLTSFAHTALSQEAKTSPPEDTEPGTKLPEATGEGPVMVDDPFHKGSGKKIEQELADLYREYQNRTDNDFNRSHDEIHRERRAAKKTSGYTDLKNRKQKIPKWRKAFKVGYDDAIKSVKASSDAFRKAIEMEEELQGETGTEAGTDAIRQALDGELGPFDARTRRLLERARHFRSWMVKLKDAELRLKDGLEVLEATSSPFAKVDTTSLNGRWRVSSKFPQDGSTVNCTVTDNSFVCVFDKPSEKARQELGLKQGDLSMKGELSELSLSGSKYYAFMPGPGDSCSNMKGNLPYEMRNTVVSKNGNKITGERKFPVYAKSSCRTISDLDIWVPFVYIRAQ